MRPYIWMCSAMYFMNGLSTVVLGSVLTLILAHYGASYSLGGLFVFFQFIGYLIGVPAAAVVQRMVGHRTVIMMGAGCIGVAEICIGCLPIWQIAVLMSCLNGIGLAMTQATVASSIIEWFEGRRAVIMSRVEVAFGLGCLVMPLCASRLIDVHAWRLGFWAVGILALLLSILCPLTPMSRGVSSDAGPKDAPTPALHVSGSWTKFVFLSLFLFMIFMYVGLETCISNFFPAIFISYLRSSTSVASLVVTIFWAAMVIGRALTGWAIRKVSYSRFLGWSIVTTMVLLMFIAVWRNVNLTYVITFLVGLSMSGIYVITMVYANHTFPNDEVRVTRLVTIFSGVGGAALPGMFGWLMDHLNMVENLWTLVLFTLVLLLTLSAIVYTGSNRRLKLG